MTKSTAFDAKKPPAKAKTTASTKKSKSTSAPAVVKCEENEHCNGSDDDGVYIIEKVLAYRAITKYEYLIEWESAHCANSWVAEEDLSKGALKDAKKLRSDIEKNGAYSGQEEHPNKRKKSAKKSTAKKAAKKPVKKGTAKKAVKKAAKKPAVKSRK